MAAGFTPEGLPAGIELLGVPWSDARLTALAYAFEQAATKRRAPPSTPPLVNSKPPAPTTLAMRPAGKLVVPPATATTADAQASFVFDQVMGRLRYQVSVSSLAPGDVLFAAIHRGAAGQNGPVPYRLLAPVERSAAGTLALTPRDRAELKEGQLYLQIYTRAQPLGALRGQIRNQKGDTIK
jgi:hypothetical protein